MKDGYKNTNFFDKIDLREVDVILELGARYGDESLELHQCIPEAKIHAFECNPYVLEETRQKLKDHPKIELHEIAVSDSTQGSVTFYPADGNPGASSLYVANLGKWWSDHTPIEIKATRLDDYFKANGINKVDLICADIQGGELNAFKGMGEYLDQVKYIITESPQNEPSYFGAPSENDLKSFLRSKNFELVDEHIDGRNPFEKDVLFVRKDLLWKK